MRTKQKGQKRGTDRNRRSFVDNRSSSTYTHAGRGMRMDDRVSEEGEEESKKEKERSKKRKRDA